MYGNIQQRITEIQDEVFEKDGLAFNEAGAAVTAYLEEQILNYDNLAEIDKEDLMEAISLSITSILDCEAEGMDMKEEARETVAMIERTGFAEKMHECDREDYEELKEYAA